MERKFQFNYMLTSQISWSALFLIFSLKKLKASNCCLFGEKQTCTLMTGDELRKAAELLAFLLSYFVGVSTDKLSRQPSRQSWSHPPGDGKIASAPKHTAPSSGLHGTDRKQENKKSKKAIKHEERQKKSFIPNHWFEHKFFFLLYYGR